jgi:tyrosine-protein phosphatase YwqE
MAKKKAKGLGDTIEQITEATGIKKLVEFVAGDDCGCEERKKKLNELFPYRNPNCLLEDEYQWLKETNVLSQNTFKPSEQTRLLAIYNRVFSVRQEPTSCASCFRELVLKMQKVFAEYEG